MPALSACAIVSLLPGVELIPNLKVAARAFPEAIAEVPFADISNFVTFVTSKACHTA